MNHPSQGRTARNPDGYPRQMSLSSRSNKTLLIKLAAAGATYGFTLAMARMMTLEAFGTVAFFLNLSLLLSVVGARGQQLSALRHVPDLVQRGDLAGLRAFSGRAIRRAVRGAAGVAALAGVAMLAAGTRFAGRDLIAGLLLVPLVGWIDMLSHIARGHHRLMLALVPKEILWRAMVALTVLGAAATGLAPPDALTVLALLGATLLGLGIALGLLLWRTTGISPWPRAARRAHTGTWRDSEGPFWLSSVSNIFLANADVLAVGLFAGPAAAAAYFVANRLAVLLSFFQTSTNLVLTPMLAEAWAASDRARCAGLLRRACLRMSAPTLALGAVLFVAAPWVLAIFGTQYQVAATPFRLLILAGIVRALGGAGDIALNMCGGHRPAMWASAASLGLNAALLVAGAIAGGATGVALAVLAGTVLRKALFWALALRRLGLRTDILAALPRRRRAPRPPRTAPRMPRPQAAAR